MKKLFYCMEKADSSAVITIYSDIYAGGKCSAECLSKRIDELKDEKQIDVYINSNGGDVFEGLAIYNALKRSKAKIVTHCDGMAASIASVIFMTGEERIMPKSSFIMIHNAWGGMCGNAEEMRKYADDLETVTQASLKIYKENTNLTEDELKDLMDKETILTADEAYEYGFATKLEGEDEDGTKQSCSKWLCDIVRKYRAEFNSEDKEETEEETDEEDTEKTSEEAEEDTSDDEESGEMSDDETDEEETEDEQDEATQRLRGFFNSLLN